MWSFRLAVVSGVMLFFFAGAGFVEYVFQASSIAEKLAPQIGVDEGVLRNHLQSILEPHSIRRAIFNGIPWAVLTLYFLARAITDALRERRREKDKGAVLSGGGTG